MSCVSIHSCECIRRISGLLNKYQIYQPILHPQSFIKSTSTSDTHNDADSDTYGVEYVQNIDYNHDLIQYDAENINPNEHEYQSEEPDEEQDILTYLDKLNTIQILNDYNHIIIDHYNSDFESIFNLITNKYSYFLCDIKVCGAFLRNNRCRETQNVLHLNPKINNEYKFKTHNFVSIDLLDSIHCHLMHLFDIGFQIKSNDLIENDEKSQPINLDKLHKITAQKQQRIIETRGSNRIHLNKFKTDTNKKDADRKFYKTVSIGLDEEEVKEINNNDDIVEKKEENNNISQNVHRFGYKTPCSSTITPKYSDLKTEILNNNVYKFDIDIYNDIVLKSEYKLQCDIALHLRSCSDESGALLLEHIMVLLLYIDYDTFRNKYFNLIKCRMNKLNEFYNFHFGLQNTVNLYGINMSASYNKYNNLYSHNKMQRFYHSCSTMVVFEGIKCEFFNVISMCGNIAPVALYNNIDNNDGIIIEFAPFNLECKYFMCTWLSSFGGEDERLFMDKSGGLELTNIILINKININDQYRLFLEALSCFDGSLCEGWKSTNTTNQHYEIVYKLIENKLNNEKKNNVSYKEEIFHSFCLNKLWIEILVQNLRGPFCKLLFKSSTNVHINNNYNSFESVCGALIRFDFLCGLFVNCEVIKTWYVGNNDYNQHSGINEKWINGLYSMLNDINGKTKSKLNKIIINNNHQRMQPIISQQEIEHLFEQKFFEKGWKIEYNDYSKKMNQIIVTKIIIWNVIKIISFNVQNGNYYIRIKSYNLEKDIFMKYIEFREVFEEINKKLSTISISEKLSEMKELKKLFPSQSIFKKNNNQKLMKHRRNKLNKYFEKLIQFANKNKQDINDKMNIKMTIMTTLTCYLNKINSYK